MSANGQYQSATENSGYIYISNNYGVSWTQKATSQVWNNICMSSNGQYQTATISSGYIYTSSNYGVTWTQQATSQNWYGIAMSANGQYQVASINNGTLYRSVNYGQTWFSVGSSQLYRLITMTANSQYQYAFVSGGYVYRSITPTNDVFANYFTVDTSFIPFTTNYSSLGGPSNTWTYVYANPIITTSDAREKTDIEPSNLGVDFINQLHPVTYKWKVGQNIQNDDGTITERPGERVFNGFLAQEVKQALDTLQIEDFAGWVLSNPADPECTQALRYTEFISPIVKTIQELLQKVENVKSKLSGLLQTKAELEAILETQT
jgi:hypothetical protein